MPWTVKDVPRFTKKAKTAAQKKKWVSIANAVLKDCQDKGGKDCEAKAIKVANSKFTEEGFVMKEGTKIPKGALRFVDQGCHAHVEFAEKDGQKVPKLKMVAYSGGVIKGHWYWDDLAIDLQGIQFKQSKYPVLEDHLTSKKIAVIGKPIIEDGKLMAPENAKFLSTEPSQEFQKLSEEGFPYQSSIYAKPQNVERLEDGATAEVNGFTLRGPASIWRKCEFKEMSVCVFGWDSKTSASAFSREETETIDYLEDHISADDGGPLSENATEFTITYIEGKEVNEHMNINELREKHPDLVKIIVEETTTKAAESFAKEKADLEAKLTAEKDTNAQLTDRVMKLEKNDIIRREAEHKNSADAVWAKKLSASSIPTHLHDKISGYVSYSKFVKEDVFDKEAFSQAVDAEIGDWESKGVNSSVMGAGFSQKEVDDNAKKDQALAEENTSAVARLVSLSGVKVPQTQ